MEENRQIEIYEGAKGEVVFDIDKSEETIWATQEQIAQAFGIDRTGVSRHLRNIFREGELEEAAVCAKNARTGGDGKRYLVKSYNLDAIISVGYRVNSKRATRFRVWATGVLKKYIAKGVAVNERRVEQLEGERLEELEGALALVRRLIARTELEAGEAKGILEVISKYGGAAETISEYTEGRIALGGGRGKRIKKNLTIGEVRNLAENLREELGESSEFGELKEATRLEEQLNGESEMDATVAARAAQLLYYIVKEQPFRAGNQQIGALLFIYYLTLNDLHLTEKGETKISDRALTALVLLIAESGSEEKKLMIGLIERLLEG